MNTRTRQRRAEPALAFSKINLLLAAAGLAAIVLGYVLMAQGSITLAPLLLVVGYAVLIPLAIVL